jgi:hypothetical protein
MVASTPRGNEFATQPPNDMTNDIRSHLDTRPFTPFIIRTTEGQEYPVLTPAQAWVAPGGRRVAVETDDGSVVILSDLNAAVVPHHPNEPAQ